ncbi:MAG: peptide chain release factor N(5)-glutamine methyltransferase [Candidatus Dasytiphilus stammeri]
MTIKSWLHMARLILTNSDSPQRDAEILLEFVTGKNLTWLKAFDDTELNNLHLVKLNDFLNRRTNGEPIAYLINKCEFWSLPLMISPVSLIPRPETEVMVTQALLHLPDVASKILDLGTGSGAIALAIAKERPDCFILGVDLSQATLLLAQYNAHNLDFNNVLFICSDWFSALAAQHFFDMIVSNPPYIDALDNHLQQGDLRFEPKIALISEEKGLADLHKIIYNSFNYLKDTGGWLLLEHGWQQGYEVRNFMKDNNFNDIFTYHDYGNHERVTLGKKLPSQHQIANFTNGSVQNTKFN